MSNVVHIQLTVPAPATTVFSALTDSDAVATWFAEDAEISLEDNRYDFWGRFTPETPSRAEGTHGIQTVEANRRLRYSWNLRGADTTVDFRLTERNGETIVGLWHRDVPGVPPGEPGCYSMDDLWYLWLENLRRYVARRAVVRSDFSAGMMGDVALTVEIDGTSSDVWDALVKPEHRNRWITADAQAEATIGASWVDWGREGALNVLELNPGRTLSLSWEIDGAPTVATWSIEGTGGKTRLTLAHSGFSAERHSDGEWGGWLNYLSLIKSLVEFGIEWLPPVKEITKDIALYYAAMVWAQQPALLDETDEEWE